MTQPFLAPGAGGRSAVVVAAAAGMALSGWLLVLVVIHAGRPVYDLPPTAVGMGVVGAVASAGGWALVARSGDGLVLSVALLGLLIISGVVSIASIGLLILPVAFAVTIVVIRAAQRRREAGRPVPLSTAFAAALLVSLGLPVAGLVAADGPIVRCHRDGVSSSSSLFRSGSGSSSGSSTAGNGVSRGTMSTGDRRYAYVCSGERLVEFEASDG